MTLTSGSRLGPYDILSPLGAGGFGEVYKARDTRLNRTVAIKILPSADPELKARFEREVGRPVPPLYRCPRKLHRPRTARKMVQPPSPPSAQRLQTKKKPPVDAAISG